MAEGILRRRAAELRLPINVSSAGLMQGGKPATPDAVSVLADRGMDISAHVSRRLDREMLNDADLVLVMTRDHLREAVLTEPAAFPKVFLLRELVRRLDENPGASLKTLNQGRTTSDYTGANGADDDVPDPIGQSRKRYLVTADELDSLLTTLVKQLETL